MRVVIIICDDYVDLKKKDRLMMGGWVVIKCDEIELSRAARWDG